MINTEEKMNKPWRYRNKAILVAAVVCCQFLASWAANTQPYVVSTIKQNPSRSANDSILSKSQKSVYRFAVNGIDYDVYKVFEVDVSRGYYISINRNYPPPYVEPELSAPPSPFAILIQDDSVRHLVFHKCRLVPDKNGSLAQKVFAAIDSVDSMNCSNLSGSERINFVSRHLDGARTYFPDENKKNCFESSLDTLIKVASVIANSSVKGKSSPLNFFLARMYRVKARGFGFWDRQLTDSALKYYRIIDSLESESNMQLFDHGATLLLGGKQDILTAEKVFNRLLLDTASESNDLYSFSKLLVRLRQSNWCEILLSPMPSCGFLCEYLPETIQRDAVFSVIKAPREGLYDENLEKARNVCKLLIQNSDPIKNTTRIKQAN